MLIFILYNIKKTKEGTAQGVGVTTDLPEGRQGVGIRRLTRVFTQKNA